MKRVLVGFSGGIDSCAAVDLLREQGYEVVAVTLDMLGDEQMLAKARESALSLDVDLRIQDVRQRFECHVIDYFINEYMRGRTPAPCTVCNPLIKWQVLYEIAQREGFDHIATGHYVSIEHYCGRWYVALASDLLKDQSYYLWALPQHVLKMALTPMGCMVKREVRARRGVPRGEPESMGVCFLHGQSYGSLLAQRMPGQIVEGEIVDKTGMMIGVHKGYPLYTIGQKKGLGLTNGGSIIAVDALHNRLVAGSDSDLYHHNLIIGNCAIVDFDELLSSRCVKVKIRGVGRNPSGYCIVNKVDQGLHITLDSPAWAAAVGQPVVLYIGNRVVGGGFLEHYY